MSLEKALRLVREHYLKKGVGEDEVDKYVPKPKTIYNKISLDVLHNHGTRQGILLDQDEVIEKLCS